MDDQIMGAGRQIQQISVGNEASIGKGRSPNLRRTCHNRGLCKRSVNVDESFFDLLNGVVVQEPRADITDPRGARTGMGQCGFISKAWRLGRHNQRR